MNAGNRFQSYIIHLS